MTAKTKRAARIWATGFFTVMALPALVGAQAASAGEGEPGGAAARSAAPLGVEIVVQERGAAGVGDPVEPELARGLAEETATASSFLMRQLRFPRVRRAFEARKSGVEALFQARGIDEPAELFFRVFKREQLLEVWARDASESTYVLVNTYPVCGMSGELGPKRAQGDEQVPEGFYSIDLFNPVSNFHLSLRVDYPNAVDRARRARRSLGGDIFIHGGCATIGCVPVTDRWIEELYVMAVHVRDAGQERIPVHLFPTRLDEDGMAWLRETYGSDHPDLQFWYDLRLGYLAFERTGIPPRVEQHRGRYVFPIGEPAG